MEQTNKILKEIEFLKNILSYYNFEQNHILSDFLPRIIFIATLEITISLAFLHFGYIFFGILFFFIGLFEMMRRVYELRKEINKILHKRLRINAEISRRYEELGVDAKKILEVVNSVKKV